MPGQLEIAKHRLNRGRKIMFFFYSFPWTYTVKVRFEPQQLRIPSNEKFWFRFFHHASIKNDCDPKKGKYCADLQRW